MDQNDMMARVVAAKATMKQAANVEGKEGTDIVMRTMPIRGMIVTINGLRFVVQSYSSKKGDLHLRRIST